MGMYELVYPIAKLNKEEIDNLCDFLSTSTKRMFVRFVMYLKEEHPGIWELLLAEDHSLYQKSATIVEYLNMIASKSKEDLYMEGKYYYSGFTMGKWYTMDSRSEKALNSYRNSPELLDIEGFCNDHIMDTKFTKIRGKHGKRRRKA